MNTVWGKNQDVIDKSEKYGIIVLEIDCERSVAKNTKLPRNSYLVTYMTDGVEHNDIIIGLKTNIFDCYYDSLGKGSLQSIEYTNGNVTAKLFDAKNTLTHQIKELQNRKNDLFDFKSETEDLDDLADEIFEALYQHTSSQRNETETETSQIDINNP